MENMKLYNAVRVAPTTALKTISAGRLKGMTDINPMWRIQALTEQFGPVGIGWYYSITNQWLEQGANGEICAFTNIELFVKVDGEWSMPIEGTGGSMLVTKESKGMYSSDECYKKALTDAISVACKALGFAADVYWSAGRDSKYKTEPIDPPDNNGDPAPTTDELISAEQKKNIKALLKLYATKTQTPAADVNNAIEAQFGKAVNDMTAAEGVEVYRFLGA